MVQTIVNTNGKDIEESRTSGINSGNKEKNRGEEGGEQSNLNKVKQNIHQISVRQKIITQTTGREGEIPTKRGL